MTLTLTTHEQKLLTSCLDVLLSPFAYESHGAWRRDVCRALKQLLGAEQATFVFDLPNEETFFSEEIDATVLQTYPASIRPLDQKWDVSARHTELGVYNRRLLWGPHYAAFLRSEYYNDYLRPNRALDAIGLAYAPDNRPQIGRMPNIILHQSDREEPFGDRELELLRIVYPAFRTIAHLLQTLSASAPQLIRLLDGMGHAVYARDAQGKRHRNARLDELLAEDPKRVDVVEQCERMTRSMLDLPANGGDRDALVHAGESTQRVVHGMTSSYTLRATLVPNLLSSTRPCAVVVVAHRQRTRRTAAELRERFGLTARQVEVAYLLAGRRRQAEVAEILGISVHTARRHTECVLQKLGVRSRDQVRAIVLHDAHISA